MRSSCLYSIIILLTILAAAATPLQAQDTTTASPKSGWWEFDQNESEQAPEPESEESSGLRKALLWVPNRLLDILDIFHVDVGVGPAVGGVVRITKYGQAGYRQMIPGSLRAGLFGRSSPIKVETGNEIGVGPLFASSSVREVCSGEVGVGLDLFIAGGYAGVCVDEAFDFLGGLLLFDVKDDDLD